MLYTVAAYEELVDTFVKSSVLYLQDHFTTNMFASENRRERAPPGQSSMLEGPLYQSTTTKMRGKDNKEKTKHAHLMT